MWPRILHNAIQGNVAISDPLFSRVTNELTVIIAAPVWKGGNYDGNVVLR